MSIRRDWSAVVEARQWEPCRLLGVGKPCAGPLQYAHLLPRKYDGDPRFRRRLIRVDPNRVVRMCKADHDRYDDHEINLLPFLREDELLACYARIPEGEARAYLMGPAYTGWLAAA